MTRYMGGNAKKEGKTWMDDGKYEENERKKCRKQKIMLKRTIDRKYDQNKRKTQKIGKNSRKMRGKGENVYDMGKNARKEGGGNVSKYRKI